jgi:hypothetical protein
MMSRGGMMSNLVKLETLHRKSNRRRVSYDEALKARTEYLEYGRSICDRLPFQWHIVGALNHRNNHNGYSYGCDHVVVSEDVSIGRFKRRKGDALCKSASKFSNLWIEPYPGQVGASCKACLERAVKIVGENYGEAD